MKWPSKNRLWHRHFCLLPTTTKDGKTVWLDYVWRRQHPFDYVDNINIFTIWEYFDDISGEWDADQIYGPDLPHTTPCSFKLTVKE
jgi:hypothetical protein